MEEKNECVGFKKRTAEGHQDRSKKHKTTTLNLKDYKPDSSNTICYLQGLQRYCTEHKIKLSKINHIFLSRVCSETASGLPGLLLTLAGMGEGRDVNVHGPSDLNYLVDAMRSFTPNAALVKPKSFGPSLGSDATSMPEQSNFMPPSVLVANDVVKISAILLQTKFSEGKLGDASVVYVCELADSWGKLTKRKLWHLVLNPGRSMAN